LILLTVEFQLVKAIILDINNLYPGNGNKQVVLTFNNEFLISTTTFSLVKMILIDIRNNISSLVSCWSFSYGKPF